MSRRFNETITITKAAPLQAAIAHRHGVIQAVDNHKRAERRRVRRQEERAWKMELQDLYS